MADVGMMNKLTVVREAEHGIYLSTRVWSRAHYRKLEKLQTLLYRNIQRDGIDLLEASPPVS